MLKHNLKIAWRQLLKNRLVSGINIIGLALGLTVGIFILMYVQHENSYDQWVPEKENIYRVFRTYANGTKGYLSTPSPLANALQEEVPGVVAASLVSGGRDVLIEWKNEHYSIRDVRRVDSTFFQTFPLEFEHGNKKSVLEKMDLAILSYATAQRIFGSQNPVGESILFENSKQLQIAGVLPQPEGPSHLKTDIYIIEKREQGYWTGGGGHTYVRLSPSVKPKAVEDALYQVAKREITLEYIEDGDEVSESDFPNWKLQSLTDIHMGSEFLGVRSASAGNPWQMGLMILIGLLILGLAAINYINLATAQMSTRAKEVGIRNVAGATRRQLVRQFLSEAFVVTFCALSLAIIFSNIFLPYFNEVVSRPIQFSDLLDVQTIFLTIGMALFTGLVTGLFPAFYLARIQPSESLKNQVFKTKKAGTYRNALIVTQFSMSIGLVLFVTLVWQQVDFMMKKDLGFEKEQIAVFRINQDENVEKFQTKKNQLLQIPGVASVSQISRHPGSYVSNYTMKIEGMEKMKPVNMLFGDLDWNSAFEIAVKQGRFFSNEFPTDTSSSFVVNEAFVEKFGLENPIGHQMKFADDKNYSTIIGVTEDFHYKGLQSKIAPVAICARMNEAWMGGVAVRFEAKEIGNSLATVSDFWQKMEPVFPVSFSFLDDEFAKQYQSYHHFGKQLTYATIICLFLALIGLFGLTIFTIQRKTKEIGIRKVLGASVTNIVGLLSKDFLKLVGIAFFIAAPIAWYFVNGWLENFAYQLGIQWWVFLAVGIFAIGIALLTVGLQSLKAALANPVNSIRSE
ncbi:MAG: FtsX-like permease family protein [Saprospiraceae bacterium]